MVPLIDLPLVLDSLRILNDDRKVERLNNGTCDDGSVGSFSIDPEMPPLMTHKESGSTSSSDSTGALWSDEDDDDEDNTSLLHNNRRNENPNYWNDEEVSAICTDGMNEAWRDAEEDLADL